VYGAVTAEGLCSAYAAANTGESGRWAAEDAEGVLGAADAAALGEPLLTTCTPVSPEP
jgi:hypothetical protein